MHQCPLMYFKVQKVSFLFFICCSAVLFLIFSLRKAENSPKARTNDKNFTICQHPSVQNAPLLGRVNLVRSPKKLSNHSFHDIQAQYHAITFKFMPKGAQNVYFYDIFCTFLDKTCVYFIKYNPGYDPCI